MGCTHDAVLTRSQQQLLGPAQLQVTGSSEAVPAAPEGPSGLLQRLISARPLKVTMLLGSIVPEQSAEVLQPQRHSWPAVAGLPQQEPLLMQKDGIIRPQTLANLLQSLSNAQAASGMSSAGAAEAMQPEVLVSQTQGPMQPQQLANILQQLPWIPFGNYLSSQPADGQSQVSTMEGSEQPQSIAAVLQHLRLLSFGEQLRGEMSARLPQTEPALSQMADTAALTVRAAIPGQNGATVVLPTALPFGQDMVEEVIFHLAPLFLKLLRGSSPRAERSIQAWVSLVCEAVCGTYSIALLHSAQEKC